MLTIRFGDVAFGLALLLALLLGMCCLLGWTSYSLDATVSESPEAPAMMGYGAPADGPVPGERANG